MPKKLTHMKRKLDFQQLCEDSISPEELLIKVMRGQDTITIGSKTKPITTRMIDAAKSLMPFRLPRLNSIDASVKSVSLTHEQWIEAIDGGDQPE